MFTLEGQLGFTGAVTRFSCQEKRVTGTATRFSLKTKMQHGGRETSSLVKNATLTLTTSFIPNPIDDEYDAEGDNDYATDENHRNDDNDVANRFFR